MTAPHLLRPAAKNKKKAAATPSTTPKVTRLPGFWSIDPRYGVDPAQRIEGGFYEEWIEKRKGGKE